jgi:hypothetical protein
MVERLILRALSKDPAMRPSMARLAIELEELADAETSGHTLKLAV